MTSKKGAVINFPDIKSLQTQAAEWMATLDAESPSPEDVRGFRLWVNADPAHAAAFKEMIEFWDEMNILTEAVLPRELLAESNTDSSDNKGLFDRWRTISFKPFAALASAAVVAVSLVMLVPLFEKPGVYTTAIGEQKTIQLPDNSVVQLNTNSRLLVDFSDARRQLTLTQGEAHFDVSHNPERPFEVNAGQGLVRAIGTAFTVHLRKIDVEVIVTEGTVEVDHSKSENNAKAPPNTAEKASKTAPEPVLQVKAGSMLIYDREQLHQIESLVASQLKKQLAWREGMLVFKAEPLEQVVAEISRYTPLKIIIPERSTREMMVGGLFKVGDTASLFEALEDSFDIHVKEVSDNVVYLISGDNR